MLHENLVDDDVTAGLLRDRARWARDRRVHSFQTHQRRRSLWSEGAEGAMGRVRNDIFTGREGRGWPKEDQEV